MNKPLFQLRGAADKLPKGMREILVDILIKEGQRGYYFQSCITCIDWDAQREICKRFDSRPPATVIVNSCEHYQDEDIPF